jgi:ribosomal protein S18 acetylase RimI-like enzyme
LASTEIPQGEPGLGWVYDLTIDKTYRRRGHGRRAMELAEDLARRHKLTSMGLNVFTANEPARRLYQELGYRTTRDNVVAQLLRKELGTAAGR